MFIGYRFHIGRYFLEKTCSESFFYENDLNGPPNGIRNLRKSYQKWHLTRSQKNHARNAFKLIAEKSLKQNARAGVRTCQRCRKFAQIDVN